MTDLHPEAQKNIGDFLTDVMQVVGKRLRRAVARVSDPRSGSNSMADVDILLVVDDLATRETYRIWDIAGNASLKYEMIFSIYSYSTNEFNDRENLPLISSFMAVGLEYDLQ